MDVFYRAASRVDISTLRYVFPEWTACIHISSPFDRIGINAAAMLGAVIVVEPFSYTRSVGHDEFIPAAEYLAHVLAMRSLLLDRIFIADYREKLGARLCTTATGLDYRVHAHHATGTRAAVVVNRSRSAARYCLSFEAPSAPQLSLHRPGHAVMSVSTDAEHVIEGESIHVLLDG
jgi:hypothetical protein